MIYLDDHADTLPVGLHGTPFEQVYRAVRSVAAQVWATDPEIYRAGMAWGWYATHKPDALAAFRDVVVSALISAQAPMIEATQTNAELVEYLRQWREYRPTFPQLQSLYLLFGAVVDIQPISDPESQAVLPVDNTRLAFYLRVESVDPERPLSLSDAITIAERATPMGSRPYAYYVQESRVTVPVALVPSGVTLWVENDTVASDPPPLPIYGIPMGGMMSPTGHSTYYMQELPEQIIVDNITLSGRMIPSSSLEEYFGNDQLEPESITINNDDVIIPLYDFDVPVTDQSKLYGVKSIAGTGSGSVPVTVTADGFPTSAGDTNENMQFHPYGGYLYDSIGNKIYVGNNATVISAKVFLKNGNDVTYQLSSLIIYNGYLYLLWNTNYTWVEAYKITYTVDMVQSFNDLDTLRQMGLVSLIYNGNHQLCLKFSCAGTGITFTGSMDSVVVIAAIKQQMTVDNIGLHGMVGPMGGMMTEYVPLPTVSMSGDFGEDNWLYASLDGSNVYVSADSSIMVGIEVSGRPYPVSYDTNKQYAVIRWSTFQSSQGSGHAEYSIVNNSGQIYAKNVTSGDLYLYAMRVAVCSSSDATVITVYDSSNNPYNAFKYTASGTDYYYVLDGTQTDWTDDLASIGYHVIYTAWMKADHTIKSYVSENEWYDLYDDDGQYITSGFPDPFSSHSFIVVNAYRGDDIVTCTFNQFGISTGHLRVNMDVGGKSVQYITYMETPTE